MYWCGLFRDSLEDDSRSSAKGGKRRKVLRCGPCLDRTENTRVGIEIFALDWEICDQNTKGNNHEFGLFVQVIPFDLHTLSCPFPLHAGHFQHVLCLKDFFFFLSKSKNNFFSRFFFNENIGM